MTSPSTSTLGADHRSGDDHDDDGRNDDDEGAGDHSGGKRGVGKRQFDERGSDPWHDGTSMDPWGSSRTSPARKIGRTHAPASDSSDLSDGSMRTVRHDEAEPSDRSSRSKNASARSLGSSQADQLDNMAKNIDLLVAGMALAIGPGFGALTKDMKDYHGSCSSARASQPDQEPSPEKPRPANCYSSSRCPPLPCEFYNIAEFEGDPLFVDAACQASPVIFPKARRSRVNGRAVQVDMGLCSALPTATLGTERSCQTERPESIDAMLQTLDTSFADHTPSESACGTVCAETQTSHELSQSAMVEVTELLDRQLGYSDLPVCGAELRGKATYLLDQGWLIEDIRSAIAGHADCFDVIRPGDILELLDGSTWPLQGYDGCRRRTGGNRIKVLEYSTHSANAKVCDAAAQPRVLRGEPVYGTIELVSHWSNLIK